MDLIPENVDFPSVSIIIRSKNEERWIGHCLRSVFSQTYNNFEVILIDNCSTDQTLRRAEAFPIKILKIQEFLPGKAINLGIRESTGKYIVCLSGHCIPTNSSWLENLIHDLKYDHVAGVYGRQQPLPYSSDLDKRDLLNLFGLDKKIQVKDYFFHNANSAFRRETWEKFPFDEELTNVEDRIWGKEVINAGMNIIYEPNASVFHWHGINHDLNPVRAKNIVRILESMDGIVTTPNYENVHDMNIIAILPLRGTSKKIGDKTLLEYTITAAKRSKLLKKIIVSTDNMETADKALSLGACTPFIRPKSLSEDYIDVFEVLSYSLDQYEKVYDPPDLVVLLEETYPFRPVNLIDSMIYYLITNGFETVIASKYENRGILYDDGNNIKFLSEGFMPSSLKKTQAMVGLLGLGCITYPMYLRSGNIIGKRLGVYNIEDPISSIQVRDSSDLTFVKNLILTWWDSNYSKNI